MSMNDIHPRWFELSDGTDTVSVTKYEALSYSQDYAYLESSTVLRFMNGRGFKTTNWSKMVTTISGNGLLPVGLSELDYTGEILLRCGAPRAIMSTGNTIAMPPYRVDISGNPTSEVEYREDDIYVPKGRAWVDDYWEESPVVMGGNVATVTLVAGATRYRVDYFPEIVTLFAERPTETFSHEGGASWSFTAEQK